MTALLLSSATFIILGTYIIFAMINNNLIISDNLQILFVFSVLIILINYSTHRIFSKWINSYESTKKILESIIEISDSVLKIKKTEQLFQLILEKLVEIIVDAEMGSLMILNDANQLEYKAVVGFDFEKFKSIRLNLEDTFLYRMGKGNINQPCIIREIDKFNKEVFDEKMYQKIDEAGFFITKSAISAPILIDGVLYGMINVDSGRADAFRDEDLLLMGYFASQIGAVIRNHQLLDKFLYLSQYDKLTNVFNRSYFEEAFQQQLIQQRDIDKNFTIAIFDLNNLKVTNDTHGHQVGDLLIKNFASEMKKNMRNSDIFARYGGDEFIAVFFHMNKEQVVKKVSSLIEAFKHKPIMSNGESLFIQFSFGTASYPTDSKDVEKIISIADNEMYTHKQKQRNSFHK